MTDDSLFVVIVLWIASACASQRRRKTKDDVDFATPTAWKDNDDKTIKQLQRRKDNERQNGIRTNLDCFVPRKDDDD